MEGQRKTFLLLLDQEELLNVQTLCKEFHTNGNPECKTPAGECPIMGQLAELIKTGKITIAPRG